MAINILDSEYQKLEKMILELQKSVGRNRDLEGWVQEVKHRGEDMGFILQVNMFHNESQGWYEPAIEIVDRCEPKPFDHERFGWEVRNDILGIEPDKVGLSSPFDPDRLHTSDPAQVIADYSGVSKESILHGHDHSHGHEDHSHSHG